MVLRDRANEVKAIAVGPVPTVVRVRAPKPAKVNRARAAKANDLPVPIVVPTGRDRKPDRVPMAAAVLKASAPKVIDRDRKASADRTAPIFDRHSSSIRTGAHCR